MNSNQLINMVLRLFMRKMTTKGISAGMQRLRTGDTKVSDSPQARQNTRNIQQAMKVTRRITKL